MGPWLNALTGPSARSESRKRHWTNAMEPCPSCLLSAILMALVQVLKTAQKAGDLDRDLKERGAHWRFQMRICRKALTQLGLWSGPVDQAGRLALPMPETVNRFEESLDSINEKRRQIQAEMEKLDTELRQLLTQFHEIQYGGDVPTEEELLKVRSSRDLGWGLLKRQWLDGEDVAEEAVVFSPGSPLPEAYENLVGLSDQTADRLRREADRVQKHASLKSRIEGIEDHRTWAEAGNGTTWIRISKMPNAAGMSSGQPAASIPCLPAR